MEKVITQVKAYQANGGWVSFDVVPPAKLSAGKDYGITTDLDLVDSDGKTLGTLVDTPLIVES